MFVGLYTGPTYNDMIYLLTAIGLTPGGRIAETEYTEQNMHNNKNT